MKYGKYVIKYKAVPFLLGIIFALMFFGSGLHKPSHNFTVDDIEDIKQMNLTLQVLYLDLVSIEEELLHVDSMTIERSQYWIDYVEDEQISVSQ